MCGTTEQCQRAAEVEVEAWEAADEGQAEAEPEGEGGVAMMRKTQARWRSWP